MDTKLFFKTSERLYNQVLEKLKKISLEKENPVEVSECSLMELDEVIRKLKPLVTSFQFESLADEVYFFKEVKPLFIAHFIFHAKILEIESSKPIAGEKFLKKYYKSFLEEQKRFYQQNREFYNYYHKKATYLDVKYFTRNRYDIKKGLSSRVYDYDATFTTLHDGTLSQILAYQKLEKFLSVKLSKSPVESTLLVHDHSSLTWSASKSALIELLYALHQAKCFNSGNVDLSEVVHTAEKVLNIKLGNVYKTVGEIRNRKNGRTKFLQFLNDHLNQLFLEADE